MVERQVLLGMAMLYEIGTRQREMPVEVELTTLAYLLHISPAETCRALTSLQGKSLICSMDRSRYNENVDSRKDTVYVTDEGLVYCYSSIFLEHIRLKSVLSDLLITEYCTTFSKLELAEKKKFTQKPEIDWMAQLFAHHFKRAYKVSYTFAKRDRDLLAKAVEELSTRGYTSKRDLRAFVEWTFERAVHWQRVILNPYKLVELVPEYCAARAPAHCRQRTTIDGTIPE
jgi:hypothetical protein